MDARLSASTGLTFGVLLLACVACNGQPTNCDEADGASIPDIHLRDVASDFKNPVHLAHSGAGDGRLYVVEQAGLIRVIDQGRVRSEPFLDIRSRVSSGGEKGLLSVAFHPRYRDNGYLFVNYTTTIDDALYTRVSRFQRADDARADLASEAVLLEIAQPFSNHNGGQLAFGPDGFLYIGMGDGGSANDPQGHGQNLATLLGALLRIDVDRQDEGQRYAIPPDNPFVGVSGARAEIWAYGLRNPWRFSFDTRSGLLYLADVGQNRLEEIDVITRGGNYGWSVMEGDLCNTGAASQCTRGDLIAPILTYGRAEGVSVTGGFVSREAAAGAFCGTYVYGDYGTGRIWGLRYSDGKVTGHRQLLKSSLNISSFGEGPDGAIYVLDHKSGKILRIVVR